MATPQRCYTSIMPSASSPELDSLLQQVRACTLCVGNIPQPRPVLVADSRASILVIGQAPGTRVHASGIPWSDASGQRLRQWLGVTEDEFYQPSLFAIVPMGFCYPGKGRSGDLPPRPECAPQWHPAILEQLPAIECTLLIGQYAHARYSEDDSRSLAQRTRRWRDHAPRNYLMPHPSPRNTLWLRRNPFFEAETVPHL
ncbi:MAG: uracil-DNA glycosylase family protein, partial [Gammaproteobacteria bacterium]